MGTRREPRATAYGPRDFLVRVASEWRTPASTTKSSPVNEPLLARTETGWALDTDDEIEASAHRTSRRESTRLEFDDGTNDLDEKDSALTSLDTTRRWLVGCFVVILLAGTGWRIATSGQADLARLKSQWDAGVQKVHGWSTASTLSSQAAEGSEGTSPGGGAELSESEGASSSADALHSLEVDKASSGTPGHTAPAQAAPTYPAPKQDGSPAAGTADDEGATVGASASLNVHPKPRPFEPAKAVGRRYLAFDNHSGFHNQRKSLVNALVLAKLLNRTLLLPPARLGNAVPWEPDPKHSLAFSERCKAGLEPDKPVAPNAKSHLIGLEEACEPSSGWTYVGWDFLIAPDLLDGHDIVDRWNSSSSWLSAPSSVAGLDIAPQDIHVFEDTYRRSYQIFDSPDAALDSHFASRLDLSTLRDTAELGQKRVLQFGSLFSGSRLKLVDPEDRALYDRTFQQVVLRNPALDGISDEVRDALGSYVAVHARLGDGVFKIHAERNMERLFRTLCVEVFGLPKGAAAKLWKDATSSTKKNRGDRGLDRRHQTGDRTHAGVPLRVDYGAVDEAPDADAVRVDEEPATHGRHDGIGMHRHSRRPKRAPSGDLKLSRRGPLRGAPGHPLATHLHCRGQYHDVTKVPHLAPLNTPLYIATDSRHPANDPHLAAFFRWFPCAFVLDDFAHAGSTNDRPILALERLASQQPGTGRAASEWTSDWDGSNLGHFLLPFLEAEIAARAVRVLGTHQSTFSGYTTTVLHDNYVQSGLVAPWEAS